MLVTDRRCCRSVSRRKGTVTTRRPDYHRTELSMLVRHVKVLIWRWHRLGISLEPATRASAVAPMRGRESRRVAVYAEPTSLRTSTYYLFAVLSCSRKLLARATTRTLAKRSSVLVQPCVQCTRLYPEDADVCVLLAQRSVNPNMPEACPRACQTRWTCFGFGCRACQGMQGTRASEYHGPRTAVTVAFSSGCSR